MAEPALALTRLAGRAGHGDLLIVGPSLGTSVEALWGLCAEQLSDHFEVLGWDLPGHGRGRPAAEPFTVEDLAASVRRLASQVMAGSPARNAWYAGVSVGGAVGFVLALEPGPFRAVAALAAAPKIGECAAWRERADLVRQSGTSALVAMSARRWFAPGFSDRDPSTAHQLLDSLAAVDRDSYAATCVALAHFDLRTRLAGISVPIMLATGAWDQIIAPTVAQELIAGVHSVTVHVLPDCAHLPPAESPTAVAALLTRTFTAEGEP